MVPNIKDADQYTVAGIELAIRDLATKGRDGKITPDDLGGGTFSITNGGVFGSLLSTPILNPPQSAILGLHKVEDRPVAINGKVEVRPMMYVALSYDHRIIDGKEAVGFLVKIKEGVEDPERLLIEV
jgi:2-oxoglutarate dehydrogenase E2 component (dihydrolipoamide succinyltransferase)